MLRIYQLSVHLPNARLPDPGSECRSSGNVCKPSNSAQVSETLQFMLCSVNSLRVISLHIPSLLRVTKKLPRDAFSSARHPLLCCLAMAPKRKSDQAETPETEKKPRAKAAKKSPATEPYSTDDGWTVVPPSLLFKYAGHADDEPAQSHTPV